MASDWGIEGDHGSGIVGRRALVVPLVRPVVIEVAHVLINNSVGVWLVVDQQLVGAFGADAADESFRVAVFPGTTGRAFNDVDTFGGEHGVESIGELGIPVPDRRKRNALTWSSRSISRLRAAWVVQAAVG